MSSCCRLNVTELAIKLPIQMKKFKQKLELTPRWEAVLCQACVYGSRNVPGFLFVGLGLKACDLHNMGDSDVYKDCTISSHRDDFE